MAQCQYANVTTFIQRFGCVCVSEREKEKYRQNRGRVRNVVIMTKTVHSVICKLQQRTRNPLQLSLLSLHTLLDHHSLQWLILGYC